MAPGPSLNPTCQPDTEKKYPMLSNASNIFQCTPDCETMVFLARRIQLPNRSLLAHGARAEDPLCLPKAPICGRSPAAFFQASTKRSRAAGSCVKESFIFQQSRGNPSTPQRLKHLMTCAQEKSPRRTSPRVAASDLRSPWQATDGSTELVRGLGV